AHPSGSCPQPGRAASPIPSLVVMSETCDLHSALPVSRSQLGGGGGGGGPSRQSPQPGPGALEQLVPTASAMIGGPATARPAATMTLNILWVCMPAPSYFRVRFAASCFFSSPTCCCSAEICSCCTFRAATAMLV